MFSLLVETQDTLEKNFFAVRKPVTMTVDLIALHIGAHMPLLALCPFLFSGIQERTWLGISSDSSSKIYLRG